MNHKEMPDRVPQIKLREMIADLKEEEKKFALMACAFVLGNACDDISSEEIVDVVTKMLETAIYVLRKNHPEGDYGTRSAVFAALQRVCP